jgi:hypothetical protein
MRLLEIHIHVLKVTQGQLDALWPVTIVVFHVKLKDTVFWPKGQQLCNFWQQWMPGTWVLEGSGFGLVWLR